MNDIKILKRTDYTNYLRPRVQAAEVSAQNPVQSDNSDQMTISVRVQLPDYASWKAYLFVRQYPYLSLAIVAGAGLILVIGGDILAWLWHTIHNYARGI